MPESSAAEKDEEEELAIEEFDPTGRYGRSPIMLGKGAFKKVYKAIDKLEGIEVAWNQIKVKDVLRNEDDLERLYSEVHLLQTLKHKNIIKFYCSWVDPPTGNINFITEVFTSGNLRQYRKRYRQVDIRAVKNWSRQILQGLLYLHSHDPPVIHRDLKCDNIFVNGNHGEVKIGDLGLAAILVPANSARTVLGTPEFMAPELYNEEYDELIDIYAFGMCLLELMTLEYPYCECSNAAQIFRKVTSGVKPASLAKVKDPEVKHFIEKCIAKVSERLSARELLMDPFLQLDVKSDRNHSHTTQSDGRGAEINANASTEISSNRDFMVEGQRKDVNTIFLKLRIADSTGHIRNIHFPFDIEVDTSISVASEMVAELSLTNQDVTTIAAMIDLEIQCHIPEWVAGDNSYDPFDEPEMKENLKIETEENDSTLPVDASQSSSAGFILERLPSGKRYWSDSPRESSENSPTLGQPNLSSESNKGPNDQGPNEICERESSPLGHNSLDDKPDNIASLHDQENSISALDNINDSSLNDISKLESNEDNLENYDVSGLVSNEIDVENDSQHIKDVIEKLKTLLAEQETELSELKKKHKKERVELLKELPTELQRKMLAECKLKIEHDTHDNSETSCVIGQGIFLLAQALESSE